MQGQKSMRIEKRNLEKSPAGYQTPVWCQAYQRRLEAAREQLKLIKEPEEPEELELGIGEVLMPEADPVQGKLEQISQQMMHMVQACNEEKEIIEEEFLSVREDLGILEGRIRTEKATIEGEVSGVGGQMGLQQAIIEEIRAGISILQSQDSVIVQEAGMIFQGIHKQIADMVHKQTLNSSTLISHKKAIVELQKESKSASKRQDDLEEAVEGIQVFLGKLPTTSELAWHSKAMDETLSKIQEISTGLTTHMEEYKISESMSHRPRLVQAGLSFTHPDRRSRIREDNSDSYYTQDTREEATERYGFLRG